VPREEDGVEPTDRGAGGGVRRWSGRGATLAGLAALLIGAAHPAHRPSGGAEWPVHGGSASEQRYSLLTQINRADVGRLGVAWTFENFVVRGGIHHGVEATPLVVDGVMYFTGPWSVVYALDARTGRELWVYDPEVDGGWSRKACCDVVNRGVALAGGRVYVGSLDGFLISLDARTGKPVWRVDTLVDRSRNYTITGAPRIAGDKVLIGNGGADMGVRGYVSAYDLKTGALAWRFFTVPGDPAKGDESPEITFARKTWSPHSRWDMGGGGTVYDAMTYDTESGLVYVGVGNGGPHPAWIRSPGGGDNLFLSSIVALEAKTGRMKWYYQTTPGDSWDYTATQNIILADVVVGGKPRKVLMQAPKNGFFYMLDRQTGRLIAANAYTTVTWADRIDPVTSRPVEHGAGDYSASPKIVWPAAAGGHNWQPMAFSPQTGLVYIPVLESPLRYINDPTVTYRPGSGVVGHGAQIPPFPDEPDAQPKPVFQSVLKAWDPAARRVVWSSTPGPYWGGGGVATTAAGLVFQGGSDGVFTVRDAATGAILKTLDTGTAMMAPPITYAIDGVQYVAVLGGYGGAFGALYVAGTAPIKYENPERLIVFKLDGRPPRTPPLRQPATHNAPPPVTTADRALAPKGQGLYLANCARCHAYGGPAGNFPSVWNLSGDKHAAFDDIVLGGALNYAGMASFTDILSKDDVHAIHAFLKVEQAKGEAVAAQKPHPSPHRSAEGPP
jgi:quinohemoprotein ethanol dehydrogenase